MLNRRSARGLPVVCIFCPRFFYGRLRISYSLHLASNQNLLLMNMEIHDIEKTLKGRWEDKNGNAFVFSLVEQDHLGHYADLIYKNGPAKEYRFFIITKDGRYHIRFTNEKTQASEDFLLEGLNQAILRLRLDKRRFELKKV